MSEDDYKAYQDFLKALFPDNKCENLATCDYPFKDGYYCLGACPYTPSFDQWLEELERIKQDIRGTESPATTTEDRNPENPVTERCTDSVTTSSEGEGIGGDTGQ